MPVVGERPRRMGSGYINDPIAEFAKTFRDVATGIIQENGVDLFTEPSKAMLLEGSNDSLMNFFIENSYDPAGMTANEIDDHIQMMKEQYINDRDAILEYAPLSSFNPVIGMSLPIHKNLLMNNIFDKGAISKAVAMSPKFTVSMEQRIMTTPDGKEIDLFTQQRMIKDAMNLAAPFVEVEVNLPELGTTDLLSAIGATSKDSLSIESYISAVKVTITKTDDSTEDVWVPVNMRFSPSYGEYDRTLMEPLNVTHADHVDSAGDARPAIKDTISGTMNKNLLQIAAMQGNVKAVKVRARKDTSNGLTQTASVSWKVKTDIVEIPSAIPINTPISPEEIKDIAALYQVDQLSKIMAMFKDVMANYKDDTIKDKLDESFANMADNQKFTKTFDMAPREGYALDHVEWRQKTFFDALDTYVIEMMQVLNDPNMTVTIFGRPDLIRKIKPTTYTYQTPDAIGPVELDYERTVITSDGISYQFLSSQKLNDSNQLIVLLKPNNSDRIIYRIYDYQLYISNEIRNAGNHALPSIHAFERWKFLEYQPVQARINILNPTGLK